MLELVIKREALFNIDSFEVIKTLPSMIKSYESALDHFESVKSKVKQLLDKETERAYKYDDVERLKKYIDLKRRIKKGKRVSMNGLEYIDDKVVMLINEYNSSHCEAVNANKQFVISYYDYEGIKSFFQNKLFADAIRITNPNGYKELLDYRSYNKFSYFKSRFYYIQRATVKTSPLSYFGKTVYLTDDYKNSYSKIETNRIVLTLLLQAFIRDPLTADHVRVRINPEVKRISGEPYGIYYEKMFCPPKLDWIVKSDDVLHHDRINKILHSLYGSGNYYKDIQLRDDPLITKEYLAEQNIIIPDYVYYFNNIHILKLISDLVFGFKISEDLFGDREIVGDNLIPETVAMYLVKHLHPLYGEKCIKSLLKKTTLKYHNIIETSRFDYPRIDDSLKKSILNLVVKMNPKSIVIYNYIFQLLNNMSADKATLLDILCLVYERLYYGNINSNQYLMPCNVHMKKNALVLYQFGQQGIVINNIYSGVGTILLRDIDVLPAAFDEIITKHINGLFDNSYTTYEVVLDSEISPRIDVGKSSCPKLYWPNDFRDVFVSLEPEKDTLCFWYKTEKINLVYLGTIPAHLFYGIKGLLLLLTNPWSVRLDYLNKLVSEKRVEYKLDVEMLKKICFKSEYDYSVAVSKYFEENNLPRDFYVKGSFDYLRGYTKPYWLSIDVPICLEILKHVIESSKDITITSVYPPLTLQSKQGNRCVEYGVLLIED